MAAIVYSTAQSGLHVSPTTALRRSTQPHLSQAAAAPQEFKQLSPGVHVLQRVLSYGILKSRQLLLRLRTTQLIRFMLICCLESPAHA